jgi:DNA polymerase-3 subunit epsilon
MPVLDYLATFHTNVVFFDTETNGLKKTSSVLSLSALRVQYDGFRDGYIKGNLFDNYSHYYFRRPDDPYNEEAISVNGLTDNRIKELREGFHNPEHFEDDKSFESFCHCCTHFVAHNIHFDRQFLSFPLKYTFCTMLANQPVLKLPLHGKGNKWPSLKETAEYYKIDLSPGHYRGQSLSFHDSMYDTFTCYKIFEAMLQNDNTKQQVIDFLKEGHPE